MSRSELYALRMKVEKEQQEKRDSTTLQKVLEIKRPLSIEGEKKEVKITPELIAGGRIVSWISDALNFETIPVSKDLPYEWMEMLTEVTCFGTVTKVFEAGTFNSFVMDDGTGIIVVTYDKSHHLKFVEKAEEYKEEIKFQSKFNSLEIETFCDMLDKAIMVTEVATPIEHLCHILVHGVLVQKEGSTFKHLLAKHVIHMDIETFANFMLHMATNVRPCIPLKV